MLTKIKIARMRTGLRQWELARLLGVSESVLSKIESGRSAPSAELKERIDQALRAAAEENRHA